MEESLCRVLIVAEKSGLVEELAQVFRQEDFEVTTAADGSEAIALAKAARPDVILMDLATRGMNGIRVCEILRKDPDLDQTPIILLTSEGGTDTIVRGLAAGANDYVTRSTASFELLARVRRHLATHAEFRRQIAAERLAAIGQISFTLQHEIYNPLTSVIGFLEMSLRNPDLPDRTRYYLQTARAEARRIRDLVERLSAVRDAPVDRHGLGEMLEIAGESRGE